MSKYFIYIILFFLVSCDRQITQNFQEVKLVCDCTEQQVLELIKMYEEYGFIHIKTQKNFVYEYKIHFIRKIEEKQYINKEGENYE